MEESHQPEKSTEAQPLHPPVLDYRTPQPLEGTRARAVGRGIGTVWLSGLVAVLAAFATRGQFLFPPFIVAFIALIAVEVNRKKKHAGFVVGLTLGVLTGIGMGVLLLIVLCK